MKDVEAINPKIMDISVERKSIYSKGRGLR
jgi:hypothetical protein